MRNYYSFLALSLALSSTNVWAETYADTIDELKRNGDTVAAGFYPNIELGIGHDDNVKRTENNQRSSLFTLVKPEFQWVGVQRKHTYRISYLGEYAWYLDEHNEDYNDHDLSGDLFFDHSPKFKSAFGAKFVKGHDARGSSGSANNFDKPDKWDDGSFVAEALYGRRIATAMLGLRYDHSERRYKNNNQEFRDYNDNTFTGTAYYNLGPKTQLLIEPSFQDRNYERSFSATQGRQDSETLRVLAGVTWDATAKTTGTFKIGYFDREYHSSDFDDEDGIALSADMTWSPKSYSHVNLFLSRDVQDGSQNGATSYVASIARLGWDHELTRLTSLDTGLRYENDKYNVIRDDDVYSAWLGVNFSVKRWLSVGVRYDYDRRSSNIVNNSYRDNRFTLGLRTQFE